MLRTDSDPELRVFDPVIRFLHWLTLFLVIAIFLLAFSIDFASSKEEAVALIQLHRSFGVTVWVVTLGQLVWRQCAHFPNWPADMRKAMAVPAAVGEDELHQSASALLKSLQSQKGVQLSIANALWSDARLPLAPGFVEQCREYYQAEATSLDLSSPGAANTINGWVKQKTQDKIPTIVTPQALRDTFAVLTNAVYFKGGWEYKFMKSETQEGDFHLSGGTSGGAGKTKKMQFMHRDTILNGYRSGPGYEAAALPVGVGASRLGTFKPTRIISAGRAAGKRSGLGLDGSERRRQAFSRAAVLFADDADLRAANVDPRTGFDAICDYASFPTAAPSRLLLEAELGGAQAS